MRLRALSLGTGLVLAGATLVAVPSPAQAAAITAGTTSTSRFLNIFGPATCNPTNPSSSSGGAFTSDGTTATHTASGTSTLQDTGDPGDQVTAKNAATGKVRATEAGGQLRTVSLAHAATVGVVAAQGIGTDCDVTLTSTTAIEFTTVLAAARWLTIDGVLPKGATMQLTLVRTAPSSPAVSELVFLVGGLKGRAHVELFLPAGTYQFSGSLNYAFTSPQAAGDPTSASIAASIDMRLDNVGTAVGKPAGDGTSYAKLKNARDCATGELKGKFLKAAGTKDKPVLKRAVFKVNGKKGLVVEKAAKNGKFTLKKLPSDQDVEVKAIFKKVGGGSASFTRSYRSCT